MEMPAQLVLAYFADERAARDSATVLQSWARSEQLSVGAVIVLPHGESDVPHLSKLAGTSPASSTDPERHAGRSRVGAALAVLAHAPDSVAIAGELRDLGGDVETHEMVTRQ
jgi:hypothetical protein